MVRALPGVGRRAGAAAAERVRQVRVQVAVRNVIASTSEVFFVGLQIVCLESGSLPRRKLIVYNAETNAMRLPARMERLICPNKHN